MISFSAGAYACTCTKCGKVFRSDWEGDTLCEQCLERFNEEVEKAFEEAVLHEISIEFSCNQ